MQVVARASDARASRCTSDARRLDLWIGDEHEAPRRIECLPDHALYVTCAHLLDLCQPLRQIAGVASVLVESLQEPGAARLAERLGMKPIAKLTLAAIQIQAATPTNSSYALGLSYGPG